MKSYHTFHAKIGTTHQLPIQAELKSEKTNRIVQGERSVEVLKVESYSKEELQQVVDELNKMVEPLQTTLRFKLHEETNRYFVELIDMNTNEVIKEIPPKKVLDAQVAMQNFLGLLFDYHV